MKLVLAAVALVASIASATAGFTCQQIGLFTYCSDYGSGQMTTCQRIGNFTYCN